MRRDVIESRVDRKKGEGEGRRNWPTSTFRFLSFFPNTRSSKSLFSFRRGLSLPMFGWKARIWESEKTMARHGQVKRIRIKSRIMKVSNSSDRYCWIVVFYQPRKNPNAAKERERRDSACLTMEDDLATISSLLKQTRILTLMIIYTHHVVHELFYFASTVEQNDVNG